MHWIAASLLSAFFLGCYDLSTKHAVRENAVLPILFLSTLVSAVVWGCLIVLQNTSPGLLPTSLSVDPIGFPEHLQLILKSAVVGLSWICAYFALKHLPISIASPIRATGPIWTLMGAFVVLAERPSKVECIGILTTIASFVGLSFAGRGDGVHFHRDKWVGFLFLSTLFSAVSSLYDKYLLGVAHFSASTVQAWFSIYLAVLFFPLAVGWKRRWWQRGEFEWRWSIPLISLFLLVADYVYFNALRNPDALISLVSSLRRGSTLVGFAGGLLFFREKNGWQKLPAVLGVLLGIVLTALG